MIYKKDLVLDEEGCTTYYVVGRVEDIIKNFKDLVGTLKIDCSNLEYTICKNKPRDVVEFLENEKRGKLWGIFIKVPNLVKHL